VSRNHYYSRPKINGCRRIEVEQRVLRVWQFLKGHPAPTEIKDVRMHMGLSYRQTREALSILEEAGVVSITVTADWNGCYYIYPHRIWLLVPPSL